jgi:hypothetical protein
VDDLAIAVVLALAVVYAPFLCKCLAIGIFSAHERWTDPKYPTTPAPKRMKRYG